MEKLYTNTSAAMGAIFSAFIVESLSAMIPWLMVMLAVIVADLISGLCKAYKIEEKISFSRAIRDTMAKGCTYFSLVVCFCMIQIAGHYGPELPRDVCWIIIIIESASIFGNILLCRGYKVDFRSLIAYLLAKKIGGSKEDIESMITKEKTDNGNV